METFLTIKYFNFFADVRKVYITFPSVRIELTLFVKAYSELNGCTSLAVGGTILDKSKTRWKSFRIQSLHTLLIKKQQ